MGDDLYRRLGLPRDAGPEQIKRAYRKLSKKLHPDVVGGKPDDFARLTEAYDVLSDPERKMAYDTTGQWRSGSLHDLGREVHDPVTKEALGVIATTMNALITQAKSDIGLIPIVQALTNVIDDGLKQGPEMIANNRRIKEMIERNLKRMKRKGEGENLLAGMLKSQINQCQHMIDQVEARLVVGKRCKEILKDYDWEQQLVIPSPQLINSLSGTSSFGFFKMGLGT